MPEGKTVIELTVEDHREVDQLSNRCKQPENLIRSVIWWTR